MKIPPKKRVERFIGYLKRKSVLMLFDRNPECKHNQGGRRFWARGY